MVFLSDDHLNNSLTDRMIKEGCHQKSLKKNTEFHLRLPAYTQDKPFPNYQFYQNKFSISK